MIAADTFDVRFPTSKFLDGSDAMNPDPDYSAAYLRVRTDADDGLEGHGFVFTIGRGNDAQVAAIRTVVAAHLLGRPVEPLLADMGGTWRELVHDSQLRWLGPGEGRHAHGDRGRRQRALGPQGQAGRAAAVAAAGRA